jgi:hypothetical protein
LELAFRGSLPDSAIDEVLDAQGFNVNAISRHHAFVETHAWLKSIADIRGLSVALTVRLLDYADERLNVGDAAGARDVLAVVVRSRTVAEGALLTRVRALMNAAVQPRPPLPPGEFEVELLGLLARSGAALTETQRHALSGIIEAGPDDEEVARVFFTKPDTAADSKPTPLVAGLTATHLLALSRAVLVREPSLSAVDTRRLLRFIRTALADSIRTRANQDGLREAVAAAALLDIRDSPAGSTAKAIRQDISCCAHDAAGRQMEVNLAVAKISLLPPGQNAQLLDDLRKLWQHEYEPEVRLALAEVLVRAVSEQNSWLRTARQ